MLRHQASIIHRRIESMPRVQKFLDSKKRGATNTVVAYKTSLALFQQFLINSHGDLTLETLIDLLISKKVDVYDLLDQFVGYLHTIRVSQSSIHQYLVGIRSYLNYNDVDIVNSKFKRRVTMPKNVQEEAQALDQDDIRNILLKCNNRRLKAYILILASSGVRATEACAIRLCDLDFQYNPTRLHVRGEYTKTKVSRDIFISDEATRYLVDWIEYSFKIDVNQIKNINGSMNKSLLFRVHKNTSSDNLDSIYQKLVSQFHEVLRSAGMGDKKESSRRRRITFHSFRRFVKTVISDSPAGSDYSEWFLGHKKSTYYISKPARRSEIYVTKVMKYLTFLDYSALKAIGRTVEAKITELEKLNQIISDKHEAKVTELENMNKKHEEEMKAVHEKMDRLIKFIQPKLVTLPADQKRRRRDYQILMSNRKVFHVERNRSKIDTN